ncbi:hypothetical protein OsI_17917 [Oryza sativa Indica Group]|uniref:TF-B3 domain-containing protein n=2 Tax=Oryza sativa TaxID=4530 RepID=A2XYY4_ORYSI|nr:hypothetical protein OsI_17917 [Oryza sativa Indica Group]CAJ86208.1 H0101F08.7 [Oryza sativa]
MADARGSSSSSGDGGGGEGNGGAGHGDFVGGGQHNWYHGILGAVPPPNVGRQNIVHHQYPAASLIQQHHQSPTMPLPMAQLPYVPQYTVLPTPAVLPSHHHHHGQSQISQENFQDWVPSNNVAAPHVPSAFQDWRQMCNGSAFMPFGQTAANSNVFYQNLTFNSWTSNNMPRNPVYTSFHPAAIEDHHAPLFHSNNHDIDPEFLGNRHLHGVDIAGAPPAKATSPATAGGLLTNTAPATVSQIHARCRRRQIYRCCGLLPRAPPPSDPCAFARAAITAARSARGLLSHLYGGLVFWLVGKRKLGEKRERKRKVVAEMDPPIVFRRSDMESEKNDDNPDQTPVSEPPSMNQNGENLIIRFNCREYRVILRKELTNSDVGNIGRIVMPKRDAEAHLPALHQREGVTLKMDDFKFETTWNFKYRFWPNNKSRMYVLESTGGFVKHHGLQTGDIFIIYKSSESEKFVSSVPFTSTTYGESDGEDYNGDRSGPGAGEVADEDFRKPEFGWYCCAKINRKESEIREQVSKEKVNSN